MNTKIDPYRILFPIGTVFALTGVLLWLLFVNVNGFPYPGPVHSRMMIGGFLFAFINGFLMTAIPKMTGTDKSSLRETLAAAVVVAVAGLSSAINSALANVFVVIGFCLLCLFAVRRIRSRQKPVPDFFVFVGSGLLAGLSGGVLQLLGEAGFPALIRTGQQLSYQVMVLSLVLGIGCRLVPVLSGLSPVDFVPASDDSIKCRFEFFVIAVAVWLSVIFETPENLRWMLGARAIAATLVAIRWWKLFEKPQTKSRLGYLIKSSGGLVLAGFWLSAIQPALAVHWMHLTYIGGFGLMTFTVACRVSLAHGGFDLSYEWDSRAILWLGVLMLAAAVTRVSAPVIPHGYLSHLGYAAVLWLGGVGLWAVVFVRKMIRPNDPARSHC